MKSETYINQESSTIDTFSGKQKFVSVDVALKAVEMTRKEEREKAIKKFREVTCKMGVDISCDNCSSTCVIYKFKELLDKQ